MDTQISLPLLSTRAGSFSGLPTDIQREELERHGVEFDKHGHPLWHTVPEWFDELDRKLIKHFGDEYRELANKRRSRWNCQGTWRFQKL